MPENTPLHISEALRRGLATINLYDQDGKRLPTAYIMSQFSPAFFYDQLKEFAQRASPVHDEKETVEDYRNFKEDGETVGDWDLPPVRCVSVQLDNSPTFYNSIFSTLDESEGERMHDNGELPRADLICDIWDYKASEKAFCLGAVEQANGLLQELLKAMDAPTEAVAYLVFGSMWSPKEYNFHTDHTKTYLYYTEPFAKALAQWMRGTLPRMAFLQDFIHTRFTSRDGFMSFVDNHASDEWFKIFDATGHYNEAQAGQWLGLAFYLAKDRKHSVSDYDMWISDLNGVLYEEGYETARNEGYPTDGEIEKAIAEWLTGASDVEKAKWKLAKAERYNR